MKIKLTSVYVDNHEKALGFYTEALGQDEEGRFQQRALSLADRGLTRRAGRNRAATGC